jgi:hypothetical protein
MGCRRASLKCWSNDHLNGEGRGSSPAPAAAPTRSCASGVDVCAVGPSGTGRLQKASSGNGRLSGSSKAKSDSKG